MVEIMAICLLFYSWHDRDDEYIDVCCDIVLVDDDIEKLGLSKEKDDFER